MGEGGREGGAARALSHLLCGSCSFGQRNSIAGVGGCKSRFGCTYCLHQTPTRKATKTTTKTTAATTTEATGGAKTSNVAKRATAAASPGGVSAGKRNKRGESKRVR